MDKHVKDSEQLTRYLVPVKHYNLKKKEINPRAFRPPYKSAALSVYRTLDLIEIEIWQIADEFVAPALEKFNGIFEARAELSAAAIRKQRLNVISEPTPHERHADIVNWTNVPTDPQNKEQQEEAREIWHAIAQNLILDSKFIERENF